MRRRLSTAWVQELTALSPLEVPWPSSFARKRGCRSPSPLLSLSRVECEPPPACQESRVFTSCCCMQIGSQHGYLQPGVPAYVGDPGRLHAGRPQQVSSYLLQGLLLLLACLALERATPNFCTTREPSTSTFHLKPKRSSIRQCSPHFGCMSDTRGSSPCSTIPSPSSSSCIPVDCICSSTFPMLGSCSLCSSIVRCSAFPLLRHFRAYRSSRYMFLHRFFTASHGHSIPLAIAC